MLHNFTKIAEPPIGNNISQSISTNIKTDVYNNGKLQVIACFVT